MLSLTRTLTPKLVSVNQSILVQPLRATLSSSAIRFASDDEMHTVGPWPRTKEERERAAKKYNLIPEDYIPYDEGEAMGDYPKLKPIGAFNRDRYDDFDDTIDCRFYGEVYHRDDDMYRWERIDPLEHEKQRISIWLKLISFIGVGASIPTLFYIFRRYDININHPWKQRKYFPNRKYYEFPSSSSAH